MNLNKQNFSFLGGLVSQKLDERRDMDKFDKWFKVADNMRFFSTGAMQNRTGFKKIANTKGNIPNDNIRLLPFVFNNNEAFLLELGGQGYMRVFKDGEPILDENGAVKEWATNFTFPANEDLKYAQSGDIIFLTIPSKGIYEIKRLNIEGTEWNISQFDAVYLPLTEENSNKDQKLSVTFEQAQTVSSQSVFEDVFAPIDGLYLCVQTEFGVVNTLVNNAEVPRWTSLKITSTASDSITDMNFMDTDYDTVFLASGDDCVVKNDAENNPNLKDKYYLKLTKLGSKKRFEEPESTFDITKAPSALAVTVESDKASPVGTTLRAVTAVSISQKYKTLFPWMKDTYELTDDDWKSISDKSSSSGGSADILYSPIEALDKKIADDYKASGATGGRPWLLTTGFLPTSTENKVAMYAYVGRVNSGVATGMPILEATLTYRDLITVGGQSGTHIDVGTTLATVVSEDFEFFKDKKVGEVFCIRTKVDAQSYSGRHSNAMSSLPRTYGPASSKWRFITTGNWKGKMILSYFDEDTADYVAFRTLTSENVDQPKNDNASGEIGKSEIVTYKVYAKEDAVKASDDADLALAWTLNTSSSEVNMYFQINSITNNSTAKCVVIKNYHQLGGEETTNTFKSSFWYESAFSSSKGWPTSVGFYQNRLFFGKDYNLYGSKTNDFWDFYEPIAVNDDDPINMSLLSYKVNDIVNIVTLKSFFVFTAGGEFGIGSSGALTQKDKFLKQYSTHGSAKCLPIVAGNMIMFVDTSEHTVRAFQYSFETDTYEAQDISVMLDEIIKDEKIISTSYSANEKECYFLTEKGEIFVLKFFPEQNIMAWSKWKHGKYKIKNICVMPRGSEEDLYIAVNTENGMQIERMVKDIYADSVNILNFDNEVEEASVPFATGSSVVVNDGVNKYNAVVDENGKIKLARPAKSIKVGLAYKSQAVMLAPVVMTQDGNATTYNVRKTFKAYFKYSDSYGFKVGVYGHEHMEPNYQEVGQTIDNETVLTTGKKSVLMPSRYDMQSGISFLQEKPYPMIIENVMLDVDYGNK